MADSLKGKCAVITGSTSGIGLGMARALAAQGVHVMINGFGDAAAIEDVRAGIEKEFGVKARYNGADISKPDQVEALIKATNSELGSIDILINNAGIQFTSAVDAFPLDKWDAIISTNLSSAFYGIKYALPFMRAKKWGRIISTASVHGLVASPQKAAYVAAKHGIIGLTKVVGLETAGSGITCNAICPGWVLTPLVQKQIDAIAAENKISVEAAKEKLVAEKQPSKQFVTPEELGAYLVFLCSDAATQITGSAMTMDGGWTAQ
ncbi:MAG: 3-hydroxybutyrate dehydrogenase [Alphaproteobacteria bacterium]|nr:3-hydroxybutyrate dehydrogenase [Alphaproteobacteria bacterium]